ncbi:hypothetical protein [Croceicoccus sp. BE223]|uniref:hypothetical protein n=1 Tax=Croceicoccus sp. BE223 TaxID=2817716 RepID=UPI0028582188|nr:hypothetical protein [Croceicoccus sp. BE223]MDR7102452.1 RimJ/RimL family protein N-acetyltransferase [Croceicoccus sp. BE223]
MFIRSENLFFRPAWPEDRPRLERLDVPVRHDPLCPDLVPQGFVITMPGTSGTKLIGTAGFRPVRRTWEQRIWLAPAWRHLGLFAEAEETLAELAGSLPVLGDGGVMPQARTEDRRQRELVAA